MPPTESTDLNRLTAPPGRMRRYAWIAAAAMIASLGAVWLWVATLKMAYLDPEYAFWRARQDLVRTCDLGGMLILGDSRAAAGILPAAMPLQTTNLAMGGGKPIEALAVLRRALACPVPPDRVVISLDAVHFMQPDLFWERTVRYDLLDRADLRELAGLSHQTGDWSVFDARRTDGLPPEMRIALYRMGFPSLYFGNLLKGGVFLRWWNNQAGHAATIASCGQHFFGTDAGSDAVAIEGTLRHFTPSVVLDHYFDRLLMLLDQRGIVAHFVSLPVNQATGHATSPTVVAAFQAYLHEKSQRFPRFHLSGPVLPVWPDRWFGDGFSHLNPSGAARFSARFADCVAAWTAGAPAGHGCATTDDPSTDRAVPAVEATRPPPQPARHARDGGPYR